MVKKIVMRIATCQYQIDVMPSWNLYQSKIKNLVLRAKDEQADLLLMPEYAGTEIVQADADESLFSSLQAIIPQYLQFYQDLAREFQLYIQPGTIIEAVAEKHYRNRAYLFAPSGKYGFQDKLLLTEYEKQLKILQRGETQTIFETTFGKIAIAICYDAEFPGLVKCLIENGAWLILVPSYTNTLAGNNRVGIACRARAMENQCYVARSSIVGKVYTGDIFEETVGNSGIYGPMEQQFSDDGVLAEGLLNQVYMIFGEVSPKSLLVVREQGEVHNFNDAKNHQADLNKNPIIITL